MSKIRIYGDTSGYVDLTAPAVADNRSIDLPTVLDSKLDTSTPLGKIRQIVSTNLSGERSTTSTSFVDVSGLSLSITPTSSSSTILIFCSMPARVEVAGQPNGFFQIANGSDTAIVGAVEIPFGVASGFTTSGTARFDSSVSLMGIDSPATTSAVTYKVRFRSSSGSLTLVRASGRTCSIIAMEVGP